MSAELKKRTLRRIIILAAAAALILYFVPLGGKIDADVWKQFEGGFAVYEGDYNEEGFSDDEEGESWWYMYNEETRSGEPYFDIFDSEAGEPGLAGWIVNLDDSHITVRVDWANKGRYLPGDWKLERMNTIFKADYKITGDRIKITNNGQTFTFIKSN